MNVTSQMEAKDGMVFFSKFSIFPSIFHCNFFGKRVDGFRKAVVIEKLLRVTPSMIRLINRVVFGREKYWD